MTPDRAEFWLVCIARFGIGMAILFMLAVVLGLLRQVWCICRLLRAKQFRRLGHESMLERRERHT